MANEEHLAILKQGVKAWNRWREENNKLYRRPDLAKVDLSKINLIGANLNWADLTETNLKKANLRGVNLVEASLIRADLTDVNLIEANLARANLYETKLAATDLTNANLRGAALYQAKLVGAKLVEADLAGAGLRDADLTRTDLTNAYLGGADLTNTNLANAILQGTLLKRTKLFKANFAKTVCGFTIFSDVDLSEAKNLHSVRHDAPSTIGIDTLLLSKGKIPIEFLVGCGVPKHIIENMQYLVDIPTIQYYSCFISYSTKDDDFAQQLNDRMKREGLRVWFAPEEMKAGKKIHEQLYEAIRYHDKLILVLSEASMKSNWVQSEIRRARKHERDDKRRKLFPISLVPFGEIQKWELFDADEGRDLAQEIREYYIPDFSQWKNYDKFNAEFEKLLKALKTEE